MMARYGSDRRALSTRLNVWEALLVQRFGISCTSFSHFLLPLVFNKAYIHVWRLFL